MIYCSHEQSPYQVLYGEPHIFKEILVLQFHISPDVFFQINTVGADILYQTVRELSQPDENTILHDVCCETSEHYSAMGKC